MPPETTLSDVRALPEGRPPALSIRLFGPLDVRRDGMPVPRLRSRKGGWLLALLALRAGRQVERDWLAALLWPESSPERAGHSLRMSLKDLRRALGAEAYRLHSPTPRTLCLELEGAEVDLLTFDTAMAQGDRGAAIRSQGGHPEAALERAAAVYRGPLLEGCVEPWVIAERQQREQAYLAALETLAAAALAADVGVAAERYLRQAVATDPLREESHHALIRLLAAAGQPAAALRQYRELERILQQQLSVTPDPTIRDLVTQIEASPLARPRPAAPPPEPGTASPGCRTQLADGGLSVLGSRFSVAPETVNQEPTTKNRVGPIWVGEPATGALPVDSPCYICRSADAKFQAAIDRRDGLVLVKGARQMGKSSLLARGLQQAGDAGARIVLTDLQMLNAPQLSSVETLLQTLAQWMALQLELDTPPGEVWNPGCGASINFELYLRRQVLGKLTAPLVWGLDDADHLFPCEYASEVFALFRSWHNRRSLDRTGPWGRLTLIITYATEAHLFITDLNHSPFNVGTRLTLEEITRQQVAELNDRYGRPLRDDAEVTRFWEWVGGQPYLTHRGIQVMATERLDLTSLETHTEREMGIFGDHLRRMLIPLAKDPDLREAVRQVLQGQPCPTAESLYRLRSAGVLAGESARDARPRCQLYAAYLARHLL